MTTARSKIVNPKVTRWYHCISRCVRKAFLLESSAGKVNRRAWIEKRLQYLSEVFAVSVGGFAILGNHLHVLIRLDPEVRKNWSKEEVVQHWFRLFPPKKSLTDKELKGYAKDAKWVAKHRMRLGSLGWFMKSLKEPIARIANGEDKCTGVFWDGRYKSIAILDVESLLATCAYIDLNPIAAGLAPTPEDSQHTSIRQRIDHALSQQRLSDLKRANDGSVQACLSSDGLEESLWLVPIEDRRNRGENREGMLPGFSLGNYLKMVDHVGRQSRNNKRTISQDLKPVLERLETTFEQWESFTQQVANCSRAGRFLSASRATLRQAASALGFHHVTNLRGVSAR